MLAEIFGSQALLGLSVFLFAVASVICGLARSFTPLLVGRFMQGIGGGGMITLVQMIFSGLVPLRQRPRWFSWVLGTWAVGSVIGPFVGSALAERASFHWVFWINLPFCGVILVLVPFCINSTTSRISLRESLLQVDWVGGVMFICSTTSVLVGLSWGGIQFPWISKWTLLPIIVGTFGILCTYIWEHHFARQPFLRISLFQRGSMVLAQACAFIQGLIVSDLPLDSPERRHSMPNCADSCSVPSTMFLSISLPSGFGHRPNPVYVFYQYHVRCCLVPPSSHSSSVVRAYTDGQYGPVGL
jgi:MFS family permease